MSEKPELETPGYVAACLDLDCFTEDQAAGIAAEIYQPLKDYIQYLEGRIEKLERVMRMNKLVIEGSVKEQRNHDE